MILRAASETSARVVTPRSGIPSRFAKPPPEKYMALNPALSASCATIGLKTPGATNMLLPEMSLRSEDAALVCDFSRETLPFHLLDTIKAFKRCHSKEDEPAVCHPPRAPGYRLHSRSRRNKPSVEANTRGTRRWWESLRRQPSGSPIGGDFVKEHRRACGGGPSIHLGGRDRAPRDMRPLDGRCDCSDTGGEISSRRLGSHIDGHEREARRPPVDTGRAPGKPAPDD